MVTSPMLTATVQTRREQILALTDKRGLEFCKAVVLGKIKNQERLLRYFGNHIKKNNEERFKKIDAVVSQLRGLWKKVPGIDGTSVSEASAHQPTGQFEEERIVAARGDERQPERATVELRQRQRHLRQPCQTSNAQDRQRSGAQVVEHFWR